MGTNSKIEWTDHTWNPWRGCTKVSAVCDNCYMFRDAKRFGMDASKVARSADKTFNAPLLEKWLPGQKVFVCSWSDFFHAGADEWRKEAWEIIRQRPGLIFQILTKRHDRILQCLPDDWGDGWPNVWLGVTAENQEMADSRVTWLLSIPAARRFVSIEPMLGPVDLTRLDIIKAFAPSALERFGDAAPSLKWNSLSHEDGFNDAFTIQTGEEMALLDWVIVGGESGPNARPIHPDWIRSICDQCQSAKIPFMFKQWGEWSPGYIEHGNDISYTNLCTASQHEWPEGYASFRIGRNKAGCLLDGREWKETP